MCRHAGVRHACRKVCTPSYYSMKSHISHDPVGTTLGQASSRVRTRSFPSSRWQPHSSCSLWDLSVRLEMNLTSGAWILGSVGDLEDWLSPVREEAETRLLWEGNTLTQCQWAMRN